MNKRRLEATVSQQRHKRQLNRQPSPMLAVLTLYGSILFFSWLPSIFITSTVPILPPMGFSIFLCWRLIRPESLPIWAGLPLGGFDDLFSGNLFGTGILLWSIAILCLDWFEHRFPWRGFIHDWAVAASVSGLYVIFSTLLSGASISLVIFVAIIPQLLITLSMYPLTAMLVTTLDRVRLVRVKEIHDGT